MQNEKPLTELALNDYPENHPGYARLLADLEPCPPDRKEDEEDPERWDGLS